MTPKSQRQWSLVSTMAMNIDKSSLTNSLSSMSIAKSSPSRRNFLGEWFGSPGPFLVRRAFDELCDRCDGAVVFVSSLGTSGVLDLEEVQQHFNGGNSEFDGLTAVEGGYDNEYDDDLEDEPQRIEKKELDKRKNAIHKYRQNGAWVDLTSNPFGWEDETKCDDYNSFVTTSSMSSLHSIATAIRQAAASVEKRHTQHNHPSTEILRPIPIIFESLTPLVHLHGVQRVSLLLKSLGRSEPVISPIVAPVLYESINPADHRSLEDISDAIISLNVMDTNVKSSSSSRTTTVLSGVLDLVRKGGGGSTGLGGKLVRHYVPFQILRASSNATTGMDVRDGCYWTLEYENDNVRGENKRKSTKEPQSTKENTADKPSTESEPAQPSSRPRIYLQDDDPEYDDYDEEDPDDDLDL